jgi:hypothetical protein
MTRNILTIIICIFIGFELLAQSVNVTATGVGQRRDDALQDALRQAVSQGAGVALQSETRVENFAVISDAIATNTKGYISSYEILKQTPLRDRFEIIINAVVTTEAIKADFQLLAQSVGGIRFLVMYDPRNLKEDEIAEYDLAVEKINQQLASKKYRYIEKSRFDQLRREAMNMMQDIDTNQISYVQQLGIMADAQFIIQVSGINVSSRSEAFETRTASRVSIVTKAYDNCTAEGLGTVSLDSEWKSSRNSSDAKRSGISEAVERSIDQLLEKFTAYIGDWVNNGTPFELRFYQTGTFRDFRDLRNKLRAEPAFGGQMEITSVNNYTRLNCTFRKRADDLADKILDISDEIPTLAAKRLDVKFIYGRQINFAPSDFIVPNLISTSQEGTPPASTKPTNSAPKTSTPEKSKTKQPAKTNPAINKNSPK